MDQSEEDIVEPFPKSTHQIFMLNRLLLEITEGPKGTQQVVGQAILDSYGWKLVSAWWTIWKLNIFSLCKVNRIAIPEQTTQSERTWSPVAYVETGLISGRFKKNASWTLTRLAGVSFLNHGTSLNNYLEYLICKLIDKSEYTYVYRITMFLKDQPWSLIVFVVF